MGLGLEIQILIHNYVIHNNKERCYISQCIVKIEIIEYMERRRLMDSLKSLGMVNCHSVPSGGVGGDALAQDYCSFVTSSSPTPGQPKCSLWRLLRPRTFSPSPYLVLRDPGLRSWHYFSPGRRTLPPARETKYNLKFPSSIHFCFNKVIYWGRVHPATGSLPPSTKG